MSAPPHLVCLATSGALGGAETSLFALLTALRRLEPAWRMSVIAPARGMLVEHCERAGLATAVVAYPPALAALGERGVLDARRPSSVARIVLDGLRALAALPGYLRALRRVLQEQGATIVHTNGLKSHVAAAMAKPAHCRLVWHLHEYVGSRPLSARLLRLLAHRTAAIVANSDSVRHDAAAALRSKVRPRRIYNGVDLTRFSPEGQALDLAALAGLGPDRDLVRIGLVATLAVWKGHGVFIDAVARLADRRGIRAYIIGGPVYATAGSQHQLAALRARVEALGLTRVIGFTGHVTDVPAAMRALDVVVHASTEPEPFGMVIAEAMASGRAVISARAGGAAELFEDGVTALGVSPGSVPELASAIARLAADAELRQALGAAARAEARRRFEVLRMAGEFREVYVG